MNRSSFQTLTSFKQILENLGYKLVDAGNHWRTKALYRGGSNPTALRIYKDSGVWTDFADSSKSYPFERLVKLSGGDAEGLDPSQLTQHKEKPVLMEKIYPESMLERLFPIHDFYKKRGISDETIDIYRCGYAGAGQLYKRIVFPVFNEYKQIVGFSGRSIYDDFDPKWKHLGKKREWVYPLYLDERFEESLSEEVVLIESIGDSLALTERGICNHLVMFGISQMSALMKALVRYAPKKITLSLNNDSGKSGRDEGYVATAKLYYKLLNYFDRDIIEVRRPLLNDFGDMQTNKRAGELFNDWGEQDTPIEDHIQAWAKMAKRKHTFSQELTKKILKEPCLS